MNPDIRNLPEHMRDFGLHLMGRAVRDVTFTEMTLPYSHAMAVTLAAQAAEIIIKARIAEEHPLLIFSKLPKPPQKLDELLDAKRLFDEGRSIQFSDLGDILWACTGYRIPKPEQFREFGEIRNAIIHFAVPELELNDLTLRFAFEIIQPMVATFWGASLLEYSGRYDDDMDVYLTEQLERLGIEVADPSA